MNKQRIIILGVLLSALGGVIYYQFFLMDPMAGYQNSSQSRETAEESDSGSQVSPPETPITSNVDIGALTEEVREVEFDYEAERTSRNPMAPRVGPTVLAAGDGGENDDEAAEIAEQEQRLRRLRVTGIVHDGVNPMAVLDEDVVEEGARLTNGARVASIAPDHVVVELDDETVTIYLEGQ